MRTKTLDSFLFQLGQSVDISPNRAEIHLFDGQRRRVVIVENIMPGGESAEEYGVPDAADAESPREAAVMRVINGLGIDDRLSADEISRLSGYTLCGGLRNLLADMVKREKIASFGRAGYGRFPS